MKKLLLAAWLLLFVVHQDFWWWETTDLVFGVLPVGLAWHVLYSLLVAALWALAVRFAWPDRWEAWAAEGDDGEQA